MLRRPLLRIVLAFAFLFVALGVAADDPTGSRGGAAVSIETAPSPQPAISAGPSATLHEGFEDVALLPSAGWLWVNNSEPLGSTGWFQGSPAIFSSYSGADTGYIAANYNNTTGSGAISNWLLTPPIPLDNGDVIRFYTRTVEGSQWPDRLQLRLSLAGASTDVGSTAESVGDFTVLLLDINPELSSGGYPESWTAHSATLTGIPSRTIGRIALRYYVPGGGPTGFNANYIGIDELSVQGAFARLHIALVTRPRLPPVMNPINDTDGNDAYTITWTEPLPRSASYLLQEARDSAFTEGVADVGTTTRQYYALNNKRAGIYFYRVRGMTPGEEDSPWSNIESVTVLLPDAPVIKEIDNPAQSSTFYVEWEHGFRTTYFILQIASNPEFAGATEINTSFYFYYRFSGVPDGTWYFRVKAGGPTGESGWSNIRSTIVNASTP